jgi:hypothetical protein
MLSRNSVSKCALFVATASLAVISLAGCNQYSDSGLIGDFVTASKCPANGCADQAPDANYISLKTALPSISALPSENRVEIGGDCYPSTYPQNQINVTVTQSTGAVMTAPAVNTSTAAVAPTCKNGHFNVVIGTAALPTGFVYNVRLELVGIDSNGARHTNVAGGNATVSLRK